MNRLIVSATRMHNPVHNPMHTDIVSPPESRSGQPAHRQDIALVDLVIGFPCKLKEFQLLFLYRPYEFHHVLGKQ